MAKIPTLKKLLQEDFKSQSSWIGPLLSVLNQFMESNNSALNKNLTRADNFDGEIRTITLDGTFPVKISLTMKSRPVGVTRINLQKPDRSVVILSQAVDFSWSLTNNGIQIDSIVGITPSPTNKYLLTIECIGG